MARSSIPSLATRVFLIVVGATGFAQMTQTALADDVTQEEDVKAVKEFLARFHKTWESGPTRLTSKTIETAYPDQRFYYVFSATVARRANRTKDTQVLRLNEKGQVGFVSYNEGLMQIGSIEDAKVAAAAIMSLHIGRDGPIQVDTNEVQVSKNEDWVCKAAHDGYHFEVVFDQNGKHKTTNMVFRAENNGGTP